MNTSTSRSLIQDAPIPVASLDKSFHFIGCSKIWKKEFDLVHSDLVGEPMPSLMPGLFEALQPAMKEVLQGKMMVSDGEKIAMKNGETAWFSWRMSPWRLEDDTIGGIIAIIENVTTRKRKEELLRKAKEVARIGGWELDLKSSTLFWTDVTKIIHEVPQAYSPTLEEGISFYKAGKDREAISLLVSEAIHKGRPWDTELQIVTAKGNCLWVRAKGEAELVNGACVRLYGTFQDIDKEKRAELAYQEVSDRLTIATNASKIGIWDYNIVENELIWDDHMYELYGIQKDSFNGVVEAWEACVHEEDKERSQREVEMAINGEKDFNSEFRVVWSDGSVRHIKAESVVKRNAEGEPLRMIGTNWDITAIKKSEEKLKELLETTNRQNESLLNFAHIVSHNLRSHSTNLSMLTDLILNDKLETVEKTEGLKLLKEASGSLSETILHLNEVVNIRTSPEQQLEEINLFDAVENAKKSIVALLLDEKVVCDNKLSKDVNVLAIPAYLESVLLNLFTNAIKYCHPERKPHIELNSRQDKDYVILDFKDNGLGIDLEKHGSKLFGMYKTFHRHKEAKGIGLFITKNQVDAMQGKIEVDSTVNVGTTFRVFFKKS